MSSKELVESALSGFDLGNIPESAIILLKRKLGCLYASIGEDALRKKTVSGHLDAIRMTLDLIRCVDAETRLLRILTDLFPSPFFQVHDMVHSMHQRDAHYSEYRAMQWSFFCGIHDVVTGGRPLPGYDIREMGVAEKVPVICADGSLLGVDATTGSVSLPGNRKDGDLALEVLSFSGNIGRHWLNVWECLKNPLLRKPPGGETLAAEYLNCKTGVYAPWWRRACEYATRNPDPFAPELPDPEPLADPPPPPPLAIIGGVECHTAGDIEAFLPEDLRWMVE